MNLMIVKELSWGKFQTQVAAVNEEGEDMKISSDALGKLMAGNVQNKQQMQKKVIKNEDIQMIMNELELPKVWLWLWFWSSSFLLNRIFVAWLRDAKRPISPIFLLWNNFCKRACVTNKHYYETMILEKNDKFWISFPFPIVKALEI